jgi:nucleoside-diphosphate-sugar epimerase
VRVLVTGGRGFLGGHVCEALTAAGHEAIPLGRVDGDLAEDGVIERLLDEHRPEAVIHLAAVMPGDERFAQNAPITVLVAGACGARGIRLLHGSTTAVVADETPYAESKRASEQAAGAATLLRFAFPYGPGQRRGAIPTMFQQALDREPIVVYRGWERTFCFAADAAQAVVLLLDADATGVHDVGRNDHPRTLLEIAQIACRLVGAPDELIEVVDPPLGPAPVLYRLDLDGLHQLGWRPEVELEDGMRRTLEWLSSPA